MRLPGVLVPALALALAALTVLADRALVGQTEALRSAAAARIDEEARLTALSVGAALTEIERSRLPPPPGVTFSSAAVAPPRAVAPLGTLSYGARSRADLARLVVSQRATPNGLPEAVVARLALGPAAPASGAVASRLVEERFLNGDLPVHEEDLPFLAEALGVAADPRLRTLERRLREATSTELPAWPVVRRRLTAAMRIEGWSRAERWVIGERWSRAERSVICYDLPVTVLLQRAGVADRAVAVSSGEGGLPGLARVVAVPDVEGLFLRVVPLEPSRVRLWTLRAVLWLSALAGGVGLAGLRRATAREARAVERERAFLAGVTHELRSPLTAIRVLGETLAEGRGDAREYGTLVAQESERLEGLVERVLTLTRVELVPRFSAVDPAELVLSAVAVARPRAERRSASIECRIESPLPPCRWDEDAVRRAVLNLLENAILHGRPGGRIEASAESVGAEVRLTVSDDGPGIGRAERSRIFGRFERGRTDAPGTGIGLYLVDEVARAHGGRVDLETGEGRGSTFTIVLPACPPQAAEEAPR